MKYIADLHIHSHYSIATSNKSDLEGFYQWAKIKGIDLLGTGDFTHPGWFKELEEKLVPEESGLFRLREKPTTQPIEGLTCRDIDVRFCLSAEISSIYRKGESVRKVHSLIFAPDLETASKIRARLSTIGNLASDGRPILGLDPKELLEILLDISPQAYLIPAHIWTPWFSLFGSKSGFDTIEECFEDLTQHIFALETGLSSDPAMNWRWSALDRYSLVSHSDAHSPVKLGREADLFDTELSYSGMFKALKTKNGYRGTLEFYPEEGKYHLDGHRKCGVCLDPQETNRLKCRCPVCGKRLTVGVLHRVLELADRTQSSKPDGAGDFSYLIPLGEILAEIMNAGSTSKSVISRYRQIIELFGNEFTFLLESPLEEIRSKTDSLVCEGVRRMREGEIHPQPGYDGEFGVIRVFDKGELETLRGQGELFEISPLQKETAGAWKETPKLQSDREKLYGKDILSETEQLNPEQSRVLDIDKGTVLITAGPGTGKTRTLTSWIVQLIDEHRVAPDKILAITFTNKAAREMEDRLERLLKEHAPKRDTTGQSELFAEASDRAGVKVCTFHSFCFDILRERFPHLTTVFDESARLALLKLLAADSTPTKVKRYATEIQRLLEGTRRLTDPGSSDPGSADRGLTDPVLRELLSRYRETLQRIGGVDVSDLISKVNRLFEQEPNFLLSVQKRFRYIAVDELQDINQTQYQLLVYLFGKGSEGKGLLAIGDPDQAIYGFRGSDLRLFFRFREEYHPQEIVLSSNYRSTQGIVDAGRALIAHNTLRAGVPLRSIRSGESKIRLIHVERPLEEARFIAQSIEEHLGGTTHVSIDSLERGDEGSYSFSDFAVLARTRAVRNELISVLSSRGIPLSLGENRSLASIPPLSHALPVLKLLANPRDIVGVSDALALILPDLPPAKLRDTLIGWSETDSSLSDLFKKLHQESIIREDSLHTLQEFTSFLEALGSTVEEQGLAETMKKIWERFPIEEADPDVALRREALLQMAEDYGSDLEGFLKRISLNPFESEGPLKTEKVSLLTFHAAKGLEFPVVYIAGAEEGICPISSSIHPDRDESTGNGISGDSLEEERRLFYVALTRAKDRLYILSCARRRIFGAWKEMQPSRFLGELPAALTETTTEKSKPPKKDESQLLLF